jgi:hypothetical protein
MKCRPVWLILGSEFDQRLGVSIKQLSDALVEIENLLTSPSLKTHGRALAW